MSAYQALYRKWRPMKFEDVVGQKQVSETLRSAISGGRVAHAYLFCGTRGTGKTSTAKIFSRAVNCEAPIDGEPCNECDTCKGILNGSILDVYEMDAASKRGVENIREIREEIIYTPVGCKYKVYIIDEVHMLTDEAFNALLKTLEEPPAHAIFILATTEPHKIPATVLSRCQRFDFKRIGIDDIAGRISRIAGAEGIDITPDAAELVAELGDGSMRDAISVLDRCAAFGGEQLTTARISEIIGIVAVDKMFEIADAAAEDNSKAALICADEVLRSGGEPQAFIENLITHFRSLLVCKATDKPAALLEKTENAAERYSKQAEKFPVERILYSLKILGEYLSQAKWMANPKIAAEMAMVKLCAPSYSTDTDALLARIEKLETMVSNLSHGVVASPAPAAPKTEEELPPWDIEEPKPQQTENAPQRSAKPAEQEGGRWELWTEALAAMKNESKSLFAFLSNATAERVGADIEIEVGSSFTYDRIATPNGIDYISKLLSRIAGEQLGVKIYVAGEKPKKTDNPPGLSINDLAAKAELFGDKIDII